VTEIEWANWYKASPFTAKQSATIWSSDEDESAYLNASDRRQTAAGGDTLKINGLAEEMGAISLFDANWHLA